jgi:hypothetical protein
MDSIFTILLNTYRFVIQNGESVLEAHASKNGIADHAVLEEDLTKYYLVLGVFALACTEKVR